MSEDRRLDRLSSMLRRRGIVLPAFEIYGGVSGLIDYGPVGASIRRRVVEIWIDHWLSQGDIVEIDSPTITPEEVLVASGHVGEFNDLMTECKSCNSAFRADHIVGDDSETMDKKEIDKILANGVICPSCSKSEWTPSSPMNLMFSTRLGAMSSGRTAYMRPETAQGMFMLFPSLYRHFRQKLPFGAIQTGKGYRNEISPRQGMVRLREFNMAELEYFIDPQNPPMYSGGSEVVTLIPDPQSEYSGEKKISFAEALDKNIIRHPTVAWFLSRTWDFLIKVGINSDKIRFRQHANNEMAHYASDCWDCEIYGEYGWIECVGIANRTCHDLESHEKSSKTSTLRAWRNFEEPKVEEKEKLFPNGSVIGPMLRADAREVASIIEEMEKLPEKIPFDLKLSDGRTITITADMVERRLETITVNGEWFTPHVIEPAFGIDRIIWHILDHAYEESQKEGEPYTYLRLAKGVSNVDCIVLPLFDKDGMGDLAKNYAQQINSIPNIRSEIDFSKSIGRRYARADEIGIPWAITVDHTSIEDGSVTIRRRDDQVQIRAEIGDLIGHLRNKTMDSLF